MTITCIIRYQIDPFQRDGLKAHRPLVPLCAF
jgi:hypothetical protein